MGSVVLVDGDQGLGRVRARGLGDLAAGGAVAVIADGVVEGAAWVDETRSLGHTRHHPGQDGYPRPGGFRVTATTAASDGRAKRYFLYSVLVFWSASIG